MSELSEAAPPNAEVVPLLPAPRAGFKHRLAALVLRMAGWSPAGDPPALEKYVIVAAPHTALADGFWMNAFAWYWGLDVSWLVKKSLVRGARGALLRRFGAIPVDRDRPEGVVDELVAAFATRRRLLLAIPPEGTRARRTHWKSGFYRVARAAGVPICLAYLDYGRRRGGFGPCFSPTSSVTADMDRVRAFYAGVRGKVPERFAPPRLHDEDRGGLAQGEGGSP